MLAHQEHPYSLDPLGGPVARLGPEQPESGEQGFWEERLTGLQQCISELLLENQRLRMRLHFAPFQLRGVCSTDHGEI